MNVHGNDRKPTTGKLKTTVRAHESPSCPIEVYDGPAAHAGMDCCDDGSDESIASPSLVQVAFLKGNGRVKAITPVHIQVALKNSGEPSPFRFSRTGAVSRLILQLFAKRMVLLNVPFLIADDETAFKDLLIGFPVLRHLGANSRTLLEQKWTKLDGTDRANVERPSESTVFGRLGGLMIARMTKDDRPVLPKFNPQRPLTNHYKVQTEEDPFPDPFVIQPDEDKKTSKFRM